MAPGPGSTTPTLVFTGASRNIDGWRRWASVRRDAVLSALLLYTAGIQAAHSINVASSRLSLLCGEQSIGEAGAGVEHRAARSVRAGQAGGPQRGEVLGHARRGKARPLGEFGGRGG